MVVPNNHGVFLLKRIILVCFGGTTIWGNIHMELVFKTDFWDFGVPFSCRHVQSLQVGKAPNSEKNNKGLDVVLGLPIGGENPYVFFAFGFVCFRWMVVDPFYLFWWNSTVGEDLWLIVSYSSQLFASIVTKSQSYIVWENHSGLEIVQTMTVRDLKENVNLKKGGFFVLYFCLFVFYWGGKTSFFKVFQGKIVLIPLHPHFPGLFRLCFCQIGTISTQNHQFLPRGGHDGAEPTSASPSTHGTFPWTHNHLRGTTVGGENSSDFWLI